MFDITKDDIQGVTNKLLYNIWQELKLSSSREGIKTYSCKVCKEEFDNQGKYLAHMRQHKREAK